MKFFALSALALSTVTSVFALPPSHLSMSEAGFRLIQTDESLPPRWYSAEEMENLIYDHRSGFMDITDFNIDESYEQPIAPAIPTVLSQGTTVNNLNSQVSRQNLVNDLTELTTKFRNRYYKSQFGTQSAQWVFDKAAEYGRSGPTKVEVEWFNHPRWNQNSIIARVRGTEEPDNTVIVGCHQDSINSRGGGSANMIAPGADDDGSGTVSVLELIRLISQNGIKPKKTIEFHFYAAEEVGLYGSQAIAQNYQATKRSVVGMLQMDMTGYRKPGTASRVGVVTDHTDSRLNEFLRKVTTTYSGIGFVNTRCGYACSDHASWTKARFPSAFGFEGPMNGSNPAIHTANDTVDKIDFDQMVAFVKMATGFIIELAN